MFQFNIWSGSLITGLRIIHCYIKKKEVIWLPTNIKIKKRRCGTNLWLPVCFVLSLHGMLVTGH